MSAAVNLGSYYFEWRELLQANNAAVAKFKELGIYDMLLEYIDGVNKTNDLRKKSILRHV